MFLLDLIHDLALQRFKQLWFY